MNYENWIKEWLENYVEHSVKLRTFLIYKSVADKHLNPCLGNYDLDELSPKILQTFISKSLKEGNLKGGQLSANSVNLIISVLKTSLKTAYELDYIKTDVASKIRRPKNKEKSVSCFTLAEQRKIENYILSKDDPKKFGILLCFYTGLRIGELLALKWEDINLKDKTININKTCYYVKRSEDKWIRIEDTPKTTASQREFPFPKQLTDLIKRYKKISPSPYVVSYKGKPVSIRSYQKTFEYLQRKLNIPRKGFHAIRHTFATRSLECGMDVKTLSEILGHRSPTVTLSRYVHSLSEHKRTMMNKVGGILNEKKGG